MTIADFDKPRWMQCLLPLKHTIQFGNRRRLVCIPSRMDAECERAKLRAQHGSALIRGSISKNGRGKAATWTLSYTLLEARTEDLF